MVFVFDSTFRLAVFYIDHSTTDADNRFSAALSSYTNAIDAYPNSAVYFSTRAVCHIRLENFGLAVADASKALEIDPAYVKA